MAGWQSKSLAEVCQFINRGISPTYLNGGGIAVLNQKCVRDHVVNFDLGRRHDSVVKKVAPERFLRSGDVLVNSTGTGTLGRVAQLREDPPEPTTVDSHVTIVRPTEGLFYPEFFGYALVAIEEQIQAGGEGCGGQTELSRAKLAEGYHVSFPSDQNEQRRIVAILDEAFEAIATAKANAEKNMQNARNLFDSCVRAVLDDVQGGDEESTLEQHCVIGDGNHSSNYPTKDELVEDGVPFIRATNLVAGRISGSDMRFLSPQKHEQLKKGHLKTGDILITNRGEIGRTALVDECYDGANLNSQIAWLRCRKLMHNKFLFHVLNSEKIRSHFQSAKSGTALQQFTIKQLKALRIPAPPIDVQQSISARLDDFSEGVKSLSAIYLRKLAALDELKKSLLHQAFTGQL